MLHGYDSCAAPSGARPLKILCPAQQKFYVNLIRKKTVATHAREIVINYLEWDVIDNDRYPFIEGLRWKEKWNLSYWNALILAARKSGAREIWSDDSASSRNYDGMVVVNPLIPQ